jgi:hypothetical protein
LANKKKKGLSVVENQSSAKTGSALLLQLTSLSRVHPDENSRRSPTKIKHHIKIYPPIIKKLKTKTPEKTAQQLVPSYPKGARL